MHTANTSKLMRQIAWSEAHAADPEVLRSWVKTNPQAAQQPSDTA